MLSRFTAVFAAALLGALLPARGEPVHGIALYGFGAGILGLRA